MSKRADSRIPVVHFGVHQATGLVYFHQDRNGSCWGFDEPSIFRAVPPSKSHCPHYFNPEPKHSWKEMKKLKILNNNRLLQALMPRPVRVPKVFLLPSHDSFKTMDFIFDMQEFVCSVRNGGIYTLVGNPKSPTSALVSRLKITNLIPLVVTNVKATHDPLIEELTIAVRSGLRNVIILVPEYFPSMPNTEYITQEELDEAMEFVQANDVSRFRDYGSSYLIDTTLDPLSN